MANNAERVCPDPSGRASEWGCKYSGDGGTYMPLWDLSVLLCTDFLSSF